MRDVKSKKVFHFSLLHKQEHKQMITRERKSKASSISTDLSLSYNTTQ